MKLLSELEENDVEVSSNDDGDSSWVYDNSDDGDRNLYLNCYKKTKKSIIETKIKIAMKSIGQ